MISRLKLLNIFFISTFLPASLIAQIAFLSFKDNSNYKGSWNLNYDVPDFISDYFREKYNINSLSPYLTEKLINDAVNGSLNEILINKGYEYLIRGNVITFSINRLMAGEPKVAQYETYSNTIEIEFEVTDLKNNKIIFLEKVENKSSDLSVGVTIFGRETDTKKEFEQLDKIKFGSDDFLKTLVGKNLLKLCDKFSTKIERIIPLQPQKMDVDTLQNFSKTKFNRKIITGEILFVDHDTKEVFINIGKRENLQVGTILPVYTEGDTIYDNSTGEILGVTDKKIGEIEIIEIRGDRFSLGIIKDEKEKISKGNKVRKIELFPD